MNSSDTVLQFLSSGNFPTTLITSFRFKDCTHVLYISLVTPVTESVKQPLYSKEKDGGFQKFVPKEKQQHVILRALNEKGDYYCSAGCGRDSAKGVCSLPLSPLDSPYILTRGKGLLYQPIHLLRTKKNSCSIFLCSNSFPRVEGEEILGLCSRVILSSLGRFKIETIAFCHQHYPFH